MDEQLTISTPEQVAFHYEVAGIGSRFVASLLDHLIIILALLLINCSAIALIPSVFSGSSEEAAGYWVIALLVLVSFVIFWGYFTLFEAVWSGQTPGKRAGRLRVIRRDGQPIRVGEAFVRNLVRIIDFMPGFYGIGLISMFIDKDARRLGDFAAGTLVIREGELTRLADVRTRTPALPQPAYSYTSQPGYAGAAGTTNPQSAFATPQYTYPTRPDPLPGISIRELTQDDYRLIREMLARASRGELSRDRTSELATRLAYGVAERMGQDFRTWQAQGWQPLVFLESILNAKEARGE